jgi:predicted membrane chloride channel (bestrophin family)
VYHLRILKGSHVKWTPEFLDDQVIQIISSMTTFVEVFYTNLAYQRYMHLYNLTKGLMFKLHHHCIELKLMMDKDSTGKQSVRCSIRYASLSMVALFCGLNGFITERHWTHLMDEGLVTPSERIFLCGHAPKRASDIALHWSGDVALHGLRHGKGIPGSFHKIVMSHVISMRQDAQEIVDLVGLPIPFQYFHLLNLMVILNLFLWAYGMGITDSIFAPLVYFFVAMIFTGMLVLGQQLSDPFGHDDVDFPVEEWIGQALAQSADFIEFECPFQQDGGWIDALRYEKPARRQRVICSDL